MQNYPFFVHTIYFHSAHVYVIAHIRIRNEMPENRLEENRKSKKAKSEKRKEEKVFDWETLRP